MEDLERKPLFTKELDKEIQVRGTARFCGAILLDLAKISLVARF
jgi:hypothetical protein